MPSTIESSSTTSKDRTCFRQHPHVPNIGEKLCDANCITIFDQGKVTVHKKTQQLHNTIKTIQTTEAAIMVGHRDQHNGLWRVNLKDEPASKDAQLATNMQRTTSISKQMEFLHAAAGYPVLSTWIAAIKKGYFAT